MTVSRLGLVDITFSECLKYPDIKTLDKSVLEIGLFSDSINYPLYNWETTYFDCEKFSLKLFFDDPLRVSTIDG